MLTKRLATYDRRVLTRRLGLAAFLEGGLQRTGGLGQQQRPAPEDFDRSPLRPQKIGPASAS